MTDLHDCLLLVPTPQERDKLISFAPDSESFQHAKLCGFGPLSAALHTVRLIEEYQPRRVCLVGIAGAYTESLLGTAVCFESVRMDGIGIPREEGLLSGEELGFDASFPAVVDTLHCPSVLSRASLLLTVCIPSNSPQEAAARLDHYGRPDCEDMEGFGVALACMQREVPLTIIRGVSNLAGELDHGRWCIDSALRSAAKAVSEFL